MVKFGGREEVGGRVLALPQVIVLENDPEFEVLLSTGQEYLWLCREERPEYRDPVNCFQTDPLVLFSSKISGCHLE